MPVQLVDATVCPDPVGALLLLREKGSTPLKTGAKIERGGPINFWIAVGFYALIGTTFFIFNLWLSWLVLSRPR